MSTETAGKPADDPKLANPTDERCEDDEEDDEEKEEDDEEDDEMGKLSGKRFMEAFGTQGAIWFAEGKSFDQARDLYAAHLSNENKQLRAALAAHTGEAKPLSFTAEPPSAELQKQATESKFKSKLSPGLAKVAAGLSGEAALRKGR